MLLRFTLLCLMAISMPLPASDNPARLRTLFTTPVERQQLDQMRDNGVFHRSQRVNETVEPSVSNVRMQGILIHGQRQPVAFINDTSTLKSTRVSQNIRVSTRHIDARRSRVPVSIDGRRVTLKPGQQWSETKSQVIDNARLGAEGDNTIHFKPSVN